MEQHALSDEHTADREVTQPNSEIELQPDASLTPFVREHEGGNKALQLHVEGMHCARCIWAIESALQKEEGVQLARVNLSTKRLTIEWQGDAARADAFAAIVEGLGYKVAPLSQRDAKPLKEESQLLRAMAVAGFAMGNLMLISVSLWSSDGELMGMATRDLMHWLSALIALPAIAYAGRPFFASALAVLRHGRTNMDVPISLALLLATGMSLHETAVSGEHAYFDSAVMLMFFLLIGRYLDARARGKAREHASELLEMLQGSATVLEESCCGKITSKTVLISELKAGDVVHIAAGAKVPTDVRVLEGRSEVDTALVTGESVPRTANEGDTLYGGTINLNAPLK
jgi:P-type Cu2+ transporter